MSSAEPDKPHELDELDEFDDFELKLGNYSDSDSESIKSRHGDSSHSKRRRSISQGKRGHSNSKRKRSVSQGKRGVSQGKRGRSNSQSKRRNNVSSESVVKHNQMVEEMVRLDQGDAVLISQAEARKAESKNRDFLEYLKSLTPENRHNLEMDFDIILSEILNTPEKDFTQIINDFKEEITNENNNIIESNGQGYRTESSENIIGYYTIMLKNINNLTPEEKAYIKEIYNKSDPRDKYNMVSAIINRDKIITARPYRPVESKRGGKKSKKIMKSKKSKSKKYIKSKK